MFSKTLRDGDDALTDHTLITGLISGCLGGVAAYAVGCVNTGYLMVARLAGRDIRALHSGSAGARNAGRILGHWGFWVVLAGDAAKGALVTAVSAALLPGHPVLPFLLPLVVAGHIWPVQLGFRGGKGVATFLGTLLAFPALLTGEGSADAGAWLGLAAALVLVIFAHRGYILRGRLTWADPAGSPTTRDPEVRMAEQEVENQ